MENSAQNHNESLTGDLDSADLIRESIQTMSRSQLEKLYKVNGLTDYLLKTPEDLLRTHGIDYREVHGYKRLDDVNRQLYAKFLINFYNGLGMDSRISLFPTGIYYVEEERFLAKETPENDYYVPIRMVIKSIDRNGLKTILRTWQDDEYTQLAIIKTVVETYLRIEYRHQGHNEWLHIEGEKTWY